MDTLRTDDPAQGPAYLIHSFEHRAYPLPRDRAFTIGRDAGCDIMVNEVFVSRHHAELQPDTGGGYTLASTGSTPTMMNDLALMTPHPLRDGDTFLVGTMKFVFTRQRLPVAMSIAEPGKSNILSGVDDRRPTLAFPMPGVSERSKSATLVWVVLAIVLLLVGAAIYSFI